MKCNTFEHVSFVLPDECNVNGEQVTGECDVTIEPYYPATHTEPAEGGGICEFNNVVLDIDKPWPKHVEDFIDSGKMFDLLDEALRSKEFGSA
jgi:hypothetical protein